MPVWVVIDDSWRIHRMIRDAFGRTVQIVHLDYDEAVTASRRMLLESADLILLNFESPWAQWDNPRESVVGPALDVLDWLKQILGSKTPVCAYARYMYLPEVKIPVFEYRVVNLAFNTRDLIEHLTQVRAGAPGLPGVPRPFNSDLEKLGVTAVPGGTPTRVAELHQLMRKFDQNLRGPHPWTLISAPITPPMNDHPALRTRIRRWGEIYLGLPASEYDFKSTLRVIRMVANLPCHTLQRGGRWRDRDST